jgi:hypothetical protein
MPKPAASSASSTDRAVNVEKVITPPNAKGANMRSFWRKIVAGLPPERFQAKWTPVRMKKTRQK